MDILNIKNVTKFVRLNAGIVKVLGNKEIDRFVPYYRVDRHYVVAVITATAEALSFWTKQGPETHYRDGNKLYVGLSFSNVEPEWFDILTNNQDMIVKGLEWVYPWNEGWHSMGGHKELLMSSKNGYRLGWSSCNIPVAKKPAELPTAPAKEVKLVEFNNSEVVGKWLREVCKNLDHHFEYTDDPKVYRAGREAYQAAMSEGRNRGVINPEDVYLKWVKQK